MKKEGIFIILVLILLFAIIPVSSAIPLPPGCGNCENPPEKIKVSINDLNIDENWIKRQWYDSRGYFDGEPVDEVRITNAEEIKEKMKNVILYYDSSSPGECAWKGSVQSAVELEFNRNTGAKTLTLDIEFELLRWEQQDHLSVHSERLAQTGISKNGLRMIYFFEKSHMWGETPSGDCEADLLKSRTNENFYRPNNVLFLNSHIPLAYGGNATFSLEKITDCQHACEETASATLKGIGGHIRSRCTNGYDYSNANPDYVWGPNNYKKDILRKGKLTELPDELVWQPLDINSVNNDNGEDYCYNEYGKRGPGDGNYGDIHTINDDGSIDYNVRGGNVFGDFMLIDRDPWVHDDCVCYIEPPCKDTDGDGYGTPEYTFTCPNKGEDCHDLSVNRNIFKTTKPYLKKPSNGWSWHPTLKEKIIDAYVSRVTPKNINPGNPESVDLYAKNFKMRGGSVLMGWEEYNEWLTACDDKIDNDCDGYIDCADTSCSPSTVGLKNPSGGFYKGLTKNVCANTCGEACSNEYAGTVGSACGTSLEEIRSTNTNVKIKYEKLKEDVPLTDCKSPEVCACAIKSDNSCEDKATFRRVHESSFTGNINSPQAVEVISGLVEKMDSTLESHKNNNDYPWEPESYSCPSTKTLSDGRTIDCEDWISPRIDRHTIFNPEGDGGTSCDKIEEGSETVGPTKKGVNVWIEPSLQEQGLRILREESVVMIQKKLDEFECGEGCGKKGELRVRDIIRKVNPSATISYKLSCFGKPSSKTIVKNIATGVKECVEAE